MYTSNQSNYLNPNIEYIFNEEIIEYDLRDAGFSLIKEFKLLPEDVIRWLNSLDKGMERHVAIGKLQRDDKDFSSKLMAKFADIRRFFISANELTDDSIISVKKDAIFTIGECNRLKFGSLTFIPKNHYTSYIRLNNINNMELYYSPSVIDIKGMGDRSINRHRLYTLDFLRKIIPLIEVKDSKSHRLMIDFINKYKNDQLDEEFYLEFNNLSKDINKSFNFQNLIVPLVCIILKEVHT